MMNIDLCAARAPGYPVARDNPQAGERALPVPSTLPAASARAALPALPAAHGLAAGGAHLRQRFPDHFASHFTHYVAQHLADAVPHMRKAMLTLYDRFAHRPGGPAPGGAIALPRARKTGPTAPDDASRHPAHACAAQVAHATDGGQMTQQHQQHQPQYLADAPSWMSKNVSVSHDAYADWLADAAMTALIDEAELTPKPALVDRRGSGAHADLDLRTMLHSARSLRLGFAAMASAAALSAPSLPLRETLGQIGREMEQVMFAVTGGSNTHRGAIWALGLLVAGAACAPERHPRAIARAAANIARYQDRFAPSSMPSHGQRAGQRYGVRGARGEAEDGFPHVVLVALPALREARCRGHNEDTARLDALLAIMAWLDDTCLLHRGGREALNAAKRGAREVIAAGGSGTAQGVQWLARLEADLLAYNASPGGAADLLAATLFLDRIERDDSANVPASSGR